MEIPSTKYQMPKNSNDQKEKSQTSRSAIKQKISHQNVLIIGLSNLDII